MPRRAFLAVPLLFPLTLPFLTGSAPPAASQGDAGAPSDASSDAFSLATGARDAEVFAHVDWLHVPRRLYEASLVGYVSRVRPGIQHALGDSMIPWARYLNALHNQLHPAFADSFLASLDRREASDPLNDQSLFTGVEIAVDRNGHLAALGVVHSSGQVAFDLAVLDVVNRTCSLAPPPEILSPDGNAWLHWEFHRDEVHACSPMNARPFCLVFPPGDAGRER